MIPFVFSNLLLQSLWCCTGITELSLLCCSRIICDDGNHKGHYCYRSTDLFLKIPFFNTIWFEASALSVQGSFLVKGEAETPPERWIRVLTLTCWPNSLCWVVSYLVLLIAVQRFLGSVRQDESGSACVFEPLFPLIIVSPAVFFLLAFHLTHRSMPRASIFYIPCVPSAWLLTIQLFLTQGHPFIHIMLHK